MPGRGGTDVARRAWAAALLLSGALGACGFPGIGDAGDGSTTHRAITAGDSDGGGTLSGTPTTGPSPASPLPDDDGDGDGDGISDSIDNCPWLSNVDQLDTDTDGIGDVCDNDDDGDGTPDLADNCPLIPNPDQADFDGDAYGDACDACNGFVQAGGSSLDGCGTYSCTAQNDPDGDWICLLVLVSGDLVPLDNCPEGYNPSQADRDLDGIGDACDSCPGVANLGIDVDADGVDDACDGCVVIGGDADGDGVCEAVDDCPSVPNADQIDTDGDGLGDACDDDDDGDGVPDSADPCPRDARVSIGPLLDTDADGIADLCDGDRDGDGVDNALDNCPDVPNPAEIPAGDIATLPADLAQRYDAAGQLDTDGDRIGDACDDDDDGDGVPDIEDEAPVDRFRCFDRDPRPAGDAQPAGDGCDDCSAGYGPMPRNDGPDLDGDGLCDAGDPDADGDGVPVDRDSDDQSAWHCSDVDQDGCDDCARGSFDPDADGPESGCLGPEACVASGPDDDGDGVAAPCDDCPAVPNPDQRDSDRDGLGDACDPCPFSDDNDRDGDGRCLVAAERVDLSAVPAPHLELTADAQPAIGLSGGIPYVAYLTSAGSVAVVAIDVAPAGASTRFAARPVGQLNPLVDVGCSAVAFRASGSEIVVGPRSAPANEDDYEVYPFAGLRVLPFRVAAAQGGGITAETSRASYFDCYGSTYGAPGVATLDRLWLGDPSPWVVARVTCPPQSRYEGTSNRRILLGGGIDGGPAALVAGIGPRDLVDDVLVGDDRMGFVVDDGAVLVRSAFDSSAVEYPHLVAPHLRGALSSGGDALVAARGDGFEVRYRPAPTATVPTAFRRVAFVDPGTLVAVDAGLALWATPDRVAGVHPGTGVRVGFPVAGETLAARHHLVVRASPDGIELWRWWVEDSCPDTASAEVDADGDGIGDACDLCPTTATRDNSDFDGDGVGDRCDVCPYFVDDGSDRDADGVGDVCDPTVLPSDPGDVLCSVVGIVVVDGHIVLTCREDGVDVPIIDLPGDPSTPPDTGGWIIVPPDGEHGGSIDTGDHPPADCSGVKLFLPALDANGAPACEGALPVCVTDEGMTDLSRPLVWPDNCVTHDDRPGAVFNYPGLPLPCTQGAVTTSGGLSCMMVPRNPVQPAEGCFYEVSGACAMTARPMFPALRPPYLTSDAGYAVCATGDVALSNTATVSSMPGPVAGHVAAGGSVTLTNSSRVEGSVVAGHDLSLANTSSVTGDAYVQGAVTLEQQSTVVGSILPTTWPGDICTCDFDLAGVMDFARVWNDDDRLLADPDLAASYEGGELSLDGSTRLELLGGDYFLTGLTLRNGAVLAAAPGAHVRLYVAGPVSMENQTDFGFPLAEGSRLDIISDFAGVDSLANNTDNAVRVYAPFALVTVLNAASLHGTITVAGATLANPGYLVRTDGSSDAPPLSCQWSH